MEVIIYISLFLLLVFCIMAVESHSMLRSAVYLALASATVSAIMYVLGASWAAMFELSVCSGLVTVIFISAISLSRVSKEEVEKQYQDKKRMAYLPAALIIGGVALVVIALTSNFSIVNTAAVSEDFRSILWNSRQADILGQIAAILVGGIAVVVLFRGSEAEK